APADSTTGLPLFPSFPLLPPHSSILASCLAAAPTRSHPSPPFHPHLSRRRTPLLVPGRRGGGDPSLRSSGLISSSLLAAAMATFELYRRSTIGMCLTETLDEMVSSGTLSPELAIQVLVQFDKSMTDALENQVKSKVNIKGHLHTYRFCDNVWTFILTDASFKNEETTEQVGKVKIVACDSKLLSQ
ncbi:unnamed protein product, partial [Urochloa humidicola]